MILVISVCYCETYIKGTIHGDPLTQNTCMVCGRPEKYSLQVSSEDFSRVHRALVDAGILKPTLFPPREVKEDETKAEENDDKRHENENQGSTG